MFLSVSVPSRPEELSTTVKTPALFVTVYSLSAPEWMDVFMPESPVMVSLPGPPQKTALYPVRISFSAEPIDVALLGGAILAVDGKRSAYLIFIKSEKLKSSTLDIFFKCFFVCGCEIYYVLASCIFFYIYY